MKYIKTFKRYIIIENSEYFDMYYRGVGVDEAIESLKVGHLIYYSNDPISNDWEVIEYSLGESASEMSESEIDEYLTELIPWKDISKGVNLTSDQDNASGYSDIVFGIEMIGNYVEFGKSYIFAEYPEECIIRKLYYKGNEVEKNDLINIIINL